MQQKLLCLTLLSGVLLSCQNDKAPVLVRDNKPTFSNGDTVLEINGDPISTRAELDERMKPELVDNMQIAQPAKVLRFKFKTPRGEIKYSETQVVRMMKPKVIAPIAK